MNKNKMKFYFYGDIGQNDGFSPSYVLNHELVSHIIYELAQNEAYTLTIDSLVNKLKLEKQNICDAISELSNINAIDINGQCIKLNFAVFLEKDIIFLKEYLKHIGEKIGKKVISLQGKLNQLVNELSCAASYSKERLLYHVICDQVFDGFAFDYFSEKNIFCASKKQPGKRDYIIFGYEDCLLENDYSQKLLCSSNNYFVDNYIFNSFGDSNGNRCDVYRYFGLLDKALERSTHFHEVNDIYQKLTGEKHQKMMKRCGEIIELVYLNQLREEDFVENDQNLIKLLISLHYIKRKGSFIEVNVPIFNNNDLTIIKNISDIILNDLYELLKDIFFKFENDARILTSFKHKIDVKEVANELWHQIFGLTNEYLVQTNFVSNPQPVPYEGRYFRSFYIKHRLL